MPGCQLIQRCRQTGGVRKEAYEKPKRLSTLLRNPQYKGTCWIAMDYTRGARGCVALRKVLPIRTFVPMHQRQRISEVDKKHSNDKTEFHRIL